MKKITRYTLMVYAMLFTACDDDPGLGFIKDTDLGFAYFDSLGNNLITNGHYDPSGFKVYWVDYNSNGGSNKQYKYEEKANGEANKYFEISDESNLFGQYVQISLNWKNEDNVSTTLFELNENEIDTIYVEFETTKHYSRPSKVFYNGIELHEDGDRYPYDIIKPMN